MQRREAMIDYNLARENKRRVRHDYQPQDQVLKAIDDPPYSLSQVHTNGSVTLQLTPHVTERINIRRIKP